MIEGLNIVCFSDDWGRHPSSCQHIIGRLAKKNKVLWVNTIGMRGPRVNVYDFFRIIEKLISFLHPFSRVHDNLCVYSPPMLPFNEWMWGRKLNEIILVQTIRWLLKRLKMKDPILWTSVPNVSDIVGKLEEKKAVFYCYDEFSKWPGISHVVVEKMEKELINKVDLILATADRLCKEKTSDKCSTYLLPHGVDYDHFARVVTEDLPIPEALAAIKKPIIGSYGSFEERIDFELLKHIAQSFPECSIIFVGRRLIDDFSMFAEFKNIHFLDAVPYEQLPSYLKAFDVTILIYKICELVDYINPLKLREYLAAGKPVISTNMPEVAKYKDVVRIGMDKEDFVKQIALALEEKDDRELVKKRQAAVINEGWDNRTEEASNYLYKLIAGEI